MYNGSNNERIVAKVVGSVDGFYDIEIPVSLFQNWLNVAKNGVKSGLLETVSITCTLQSV